MTPVACRWPLDAPVMRLVAFAHAGAGPAAFSAWSGALAPDIELWETTLPGRASRWREPFATGWEGLVGEFVTAIQNTVPGPVVLFGHSVGALVAFAVCRRLSHAGAPPRHLIVSGRRAPDAVLGGALPATDEGLLELVERSYGGVPAAVRADPEVLGHFLPVLRADLELALAYALDYMEPLPCPILALAGRDDPVAPPHALTGWRQFTRAACRLRVLAGGHFAVLEQRDVVVSLIRSTLARERPQLDATRGDHRVELH